eukprot:GSChrysophyteH1.ASY1.ANO1.658.1 assembled CDS
MSYDRAITVFSPDGHLFQVEYAMEAVKKAGAIAKLDDHITMAFAGFHADARVLIGKARLEAQSYRLTCEDAPTLDYMARYIAKLQQSYTQRGGVRPFGVSNMLTGFSPTGKPQLFLTDPAGIYTLLEVVDSGAKNMEVAIMRRNEPVHMVKEDDLAEIIADIEKEVEEAKAKSAEKDNE